VRGELALVGLVLLAAGTVLVAPIAGRSGFPGLATALMALAAGAGVASFALALAATWRAARRARGATSDLAREEEEA
jgi:hypothetical protein